MIQHKYDGSLYQSILDEIRSEVQNLRPGVRLPSENAMCRKYNIARMTAGKILNQLANEELIERHRGRGSFVKGERVVTFLLPNLESLNSDYFSSLHTRLQIQGAMRAAQERGIRFEVLAVSPDNNYDDLCYSRLAHLHSGSMVILSYWFFRLFKQLNEQNARVVLLDEEQIFYGYEQYTRNWDRQIIDRKTGSIRALDYLWSHGCRSIALAGQFVDLPRHPVTQVYRQWLQTHPQPELCFTLPKTIGEMCANGSGLMKHYLRHHFDGVLLCTGLLNNGPTIQQSLGLPDTVQVFGLNFNPTQFPQLAPFPCFVLPQEQIGYDAVAMLANASSCQKRRHYQYIFYPPNEDSSLKISSHHQEKEPAL